MTKSIVTNKTARTRKDLLLAASKLLKDGKSPTIEEVASEALVSRATAYRYFASIDELLTEAPIDTTMPEAKLLFENYKDSSVEERLDHAESVMHESVYKNEALLRQMLTNSLKRSGSENRDQNIPIRQNRRTNYIEEALAPYRKEFTSDVYKKLCASLALVFGTESMIVFRDVVPVEPERARKIKSWAIKMLVRGALSESKQSNKVQNRK